MTEKIVVVDEIAYDVVVVDDTAGEAMLMPRIVPEWLSRMSRPDLEASQRPQSHPDS